MQTAEQSYVNVLMNLAEQYNNAARQEEVMWKAIEDCRESVGAVVNWRKA